MDRREFFRRSLQKVTRTVVDEVDARVEQKAKHYLRPPYAIAEIEFLLACTRCSDCIEACSYEVVFKLPARLGADVAGTPALDLLNKGCHLCADWPCVTACETGALLLPEPASVEESAEEREAPLPKLARAGINEETCLPFNGPECGACVADCPVPGALILNQEKPYIIPELCVGCGLCRQACVLEPKAISISSVRPQ